MHTWHQMEQSWARVRLAYLHALDRDWVECAEKLVSVNPGGTTGKWPDWRPKSMLPGDLTLGQLLDANENDPQSILGALKDKGHSPTERERLVVVMNRLPTSSIG